MAIHTTCTFLKRAKNTTEVFFFKTMLFFLLSWLALARVICFLDVIHWSQPMIDSDEQMVHPITCQNNFLKVPFSKQFPRTISQKGLYNKPSGWSDFSSQWIRLYCFGMILPPPPPSEGSAGLVVVCYPGHLTDKLLHLSHVHFLNQVTFNILALFNLCNNFYSTGQSAHC